MPRAVSPRSGRKTWTKFLLLHHGDERRLVRLKGEGQKFFPKTALELLGFSPSGDYYLAFEIDNFNPVPGLDAEDYEPERTGKYITTPYFTTVDRIIAKNLRYKLQKYLDISGIMRNFAELKSAHGRRSVSNPLRVRMMGGRFGLWL